MAVQTPIDTITDPSFTNSAKGLMTLFCIGIIHVVIGIDIIDSSITIPWLPKITFNHPELIFDLYITLVIYSIYRYCLHSRSRLMRLNVQSLSEGLSASPLGKHFVYRYILEEGTPYNTSKRTEELSGIPFSAPSVEIWSHQEPDEPPTEIFYLFFNNSVFVRSAANNVNHALGISQKALIDEKISPLWGNFLSHEVTGQDETNILQSISSFKIRFILMAINIYFTLKKMASHPAAFDFLLPPLLNTGLLFYIFLN
ncbi:hypothetical protein RJY19_001160 [Vibrio alginolyticus]|nr:hypothetical protein [Vibrio alginolyticus]